MLGYALETEYELTVELAERARTLRPEETLALGRVGFQIRNLLENNPRILQGARCGPRRRSRSGRWGSRLGIY